MQDSKNSKDCVTQKPSLRNPKKFYKLRGDKIVSEEIEGDHIRLFIYGNVYLGSDDVKAPCGPSCGRRFDYLTRSLQIA